MLPSDLEKEFHELFAEFEANETKEAQIVKSFDKIQPTIHNLANDGESWRRLKLSFDDIYNHKKAYMEHDETIAQIFAEIMKEAKDRDLLK